jgi:hypothetical protein
MQYEGSMDIRSVIIWHSNAVANPLLRLADLAYEKLLIDPYAGRPL